MHGLKLGRRELRERVSAADGVAKDALDEFDEI